MSPPFRNKKSQNCVLLCYKGNELKNIYATVIVLMHDTLSECLQIYEVSLKYLWRLSSYRADTVLWWRHTNKCKGKKYMQQLWFLCMTRRLNVLYKCMKICWNTSNGYGHEIALQMIKGKQLQNIQSGVMVFLCDTLSHCALEVHGVSTK